MTLLDPTASEISRLAVPGSTELGGNRGQCQGSRAAMS